MYLVKKHHYRLTNTETGTLDTSGTEKDHKCPLSVRRCVSVSKV